MVQIDRYSSYITESLMLSNNFNTIKVSTNQKVSEPQAFTVGNGQKTEQRILGNQCVRQPQMQAQQPTYAQGQGEFIDLYVEVCPYNILCVLKMPKLALIGGQLNLSKAMHQSLAVEVSYSLLLGFRRDLLLPQISTHK